MSNPLIEQAKKFEFVAMWWLWVVRYQDDSSNASPPIGPHPHMGFGYRAGQFWPNGARQGNHTDDWNAFFGRMAEEEKLSHISIDALYCYERYSSCKRFIDSNGLDYRFPQ